MIDFATKHRNRIMLLLTKNWNLKLGDKVICYHPFYKRKIGIVEDRLFGIFYKTRFEYDWAVYRRWFLWFRLEKAITGSQDL